LSVRSSAKTSWNFSAARRRTSTSGSASPRSRLARVASSRPARAAGVEDGQFRVGCGVLRGRRPDEVQLAEQVGTGFDRRARSGEAGPDGIGGRRTHDRIRRREERVELLGDRTVHFGDQRNRADDHSRLLVAE
jgi:hypothetical protein